MKVITAPEVFHYDFSGWAPYVHAHSHGAKTVFLAGGITGCPGWQSTVIDGLRSTNRTLFNPRRPDFPINDPTAAKAQILWEHEHLHKAHEILFWFPKETLCPITLFELGKYLKSDKRLFIGTDPEYARRQDVVIQVGIERGQAGCPIVDSLQDLITLVREAR